jgi:hypothetical protein
LLENLKCCVGSIVSEVSGERGEDFVCRRLEFVTELFRARPPLSLDDVCARRPFQGLACYIFGGMIKKVMPTERTGGGASDDWWRKGLHSRTEADSSRYKDHLQPTKLKQSKIATEELVKRYPSMEDYTTRELGYEMELIYLSGRLISYMSLICRCFLVCRFFEHFKVNF